MENFFGNNAAAAALTEMVEGQRIPQTLLFWGPEGVGKATLARRFAALLVGAASAADAAKIERDDLSRESNLQIIADREKWAADKRNERPDLRPRGTVAPDQYPANAPAEGPRIVEALERFLACFPH